MLIQNLTHPTYDYLSVDWFKWRLAFESGQEFIDSYLQKLSSRETTEDFTLRKTLSYCPAFAKAAINEIKNSIFQRMADITRAGGSTLYQRAVEANDGGVDLRGNSMNSFLGCEILPELLTMSKVGVYVDMPILEGNTIADTQGKRPYLYSYRAEDILSWAYDTPGKPNEFSHLLLCDHLYAKDSETELPIDKVERLRYLRLVDGHVVLKFTNEDGDGIDIDGNPSDEEYHLSITRIPFVLFELPTSLMQDVADYQIALLNLESADINYALKANFPFYTEQYDPRCEAAYNKPTEKQGESDKVKVKVGVSQGRRYGVNLERPAFINPSSEPLKVSMEKGKQLRDDIRHLVNLAVTNFAKMASAESKSYDNQGLEGGLSFIGLTLEKGEKLIADYWAQYEGTVPANISYPKSYSLKSDSDRLSEAKSKTELRDSVSSTTFKRELSKQIALTLLGGKVKDDVLDIILKEIDEAPTTESDASAITQDLDNGLVTAATASIARGYPKGEAEKAKKEHAERLAEIQKAQMPGQARGLPDLQAGQPTSSDEKVDKPKRGPAK